MGKSANLLKILVLDDDPLIMMDAEAQNHPAIEFSALSPSRSQHRGGLYRTGTSSSSTSIPSAGSISSQSSASAPACRRSSRGRADAHGKSLEHILLLAELHDAAFSLPKPLDALELALAVIELIRARSDAGHLSHVAEEHERRLEW